MKMSLARLALAPLFIMLSSCDPRPSPSSDPATGTGDTMRLDAPVDSTDIAAVTSMLARQRTAWEAVAPGEYRFTYVPRCFCPMVRIAITVAGDSARVTGTTGDTTALKFYLDEGVPTIDSLFARLARSAAEDPAEMRVRYDSTWHYPVESWTDFSRMAADEEFGFAVDSFVVPGAQR